MSLPDFINEMWAVGGFALRALIAGGVIAYLTHLLILVVLA